MLDFSMSFLYSIGVIPDALYNQFASASVFTELNKAGKLFEDINNQAGIEEQDSLSGFSAYYGLLYNGFLTLFSIIIKLITFPSIIIVFIKVLFTATFGENYFIDLFFSLWENIIKLLMIIFAIQYITGRS